MKGWRCKWIQKKTDNGRLVPLETNEVASAMSSNDRKEIRMFDATKKRKRKTSMCNSCLQSKTCGCCLHGMDNQGEAFALRQKKKTKTSTTMNEKRKRDTVCEDTHSKSGPAKEKKTTGQGPAGQSNKW